MKLEISESSLCYQSRKSSLTRPQSRLSLITSRLLSVSYFFSGKTEKMTFFFFFLFLSRDVLTVQNLTGMHCKRMRFAFLKKTVKVPRLSSFFSKFHSVIVPLFMTSNIQLMFQGVKFHSADSFISLIPTQ